MGRTFLVGGLFLGIVLYCRGGGVDLGYVGLWVVGAGVVLTRDAQI